MNNQVMWKLMNNQVMWKSMNNQVVWKLINIQVCECWWIFKYVNEYSINVNINE